MKKNKGIVVDDLKKNRSTWKNPQNLLEESQKQSEKGRKRVVMGMVHGYISN